MNLKGFFQKNWVYLTIIALMLIVTAIFFKPQFEGYGVRQHDNIEAIGMSNETNLYREYTGEEPKWTSSAFGGMPTEQISLDKPGNWFKAILNGYFKVFPGSFGLILLHVFCFLLFARLLRLNPWVGLLGAIAFSFASYELIVIQAGHLIKSGAVAFLPALLGAFIYAYKTNRMWGIVLSGIFMAFELTMNHVQITYYFLFVLLFIGVYFLYEAIRRKEVKKFAITSVGILAAFFLAFAVNSGNIMLTNDYAKYSIRGGNDVTINPDGTASANQSGGLDRDYITQWSYGVGETFTLVSPYVKGGASEKIANSPFAGQIENSDMSQAQVNGVLQGYSYWGTQPITSGPVYLGVVVVLLAFLGLFFLRDKIKWPLFAVTILTVMLSWGKNFMGLTNFFIDHVPAYDKFRAVTMILIVAELTVPVMGVLFLNELIKHRERILEQKKKFLIVLGAFAFFLIIVRVVGLNDGYTNPMESGQYAGLNEMYKEQIMKMDPQVAQSQYQLNLADPQQVQQFIDAQVESQMSAYKDLKSARKDIFNSSMNRSILFTLFAGGLFLVFLYSKSEKTATTVLIAGLIILVFADTIPVAYNYLGAVEDASGSGYKYWDDASLAAYPISATKGDEEILDSEVRQNPALASKITNAKVKGEALADELGYTGAVRSNVINSYRFYALKSATNYRVLDFSGAFSSSRASYYHKSLGGYHGAKLRNINNLIDFHLSRTNNKVLDMMNVKYFLQPMQNGMDTAILNPTALGNAWLVKDVKEYPTANDEIRALGNKFKLENKGTGILLVNKQPVKNVEVFGGEKLQYLVPGRPDSIPIQLASGLGKGQEAMFVMDVRGNTNLVPLMTLEMDTAKSFTPLVYLKVEDSFNPANQAVMMNSFSKQLTKKQFSGEGTVKLLSSAPNKLTYKADVKGDQLAVFSEIYYPIGWKAFVDGKETPILKVNYLLRGLELKNGSHKIEFTYDLPKYYTYDMISRIGSILLLLLLVGVIYMEFRKRKNDNIAETE
ncbi:YfhO family protein [Fluviicola sp.]|jgi:cbb3-type cytochrome oxidase subunit 3|uniref:YfhO family protein n=1 Tax=Fluviicola sp. TaxID=1917219 RepID=UPI00281C9253|nr:YfhO family protein [Fluviicola sp.]MDR0802522.1 YfhO family protein [Fluviicola sp.]